MVKRQPVAANVVDLREAVLDRVFSALSDATRRRIVHMLAERELSVGEVAEPFDMSLPAVSKHLAILEATGLVRRRKDGRTHYCSLNPEALAGALDWISIYRQFWRRRFDALNAELARPDKKDKRDK